jgi:uncharacterized protein YukE
MTYSWDPIPMIQGVTAFKTHSANIQQRLADLHIFATNNMADWEDDAKKMYEDHKRAWDTAVTNMNNILTEKAAPTLNNSIMNYETAETVNKNRFVV